MTPAQFRSLGPQLADFLDEFAGCFLRSEPRSHVASYVRGQLADFSGTPRRTLQDSLNWSDWRSLPGARPHPDDRSAGPC